MSDPTEHLIIVRVNLTDQTCPISVDVGTLNPTIASGILYQASVVLDAQRGPVVTIIYGDEVLDVVDVSMIADEQMPSDEDE